MTCTNPELAGHKKPAGKNTQASFDCVRMTYILVQVNGIENRVKVIHITPQLSLQIQFPGKNALV